MIAGCLEWQEHGLKPPATVGEATQEYFDEQDIFGRWLEDACETGPREWELTARLFCSWNDYARKSGEDPGSVKAFAASLGRHGFAPDRKRVDGRAQRAFTGLALRYDPATAGISHD
jgi:putative DNA primase/helicase